MAYRLAPDKAPDIGPLGEGDLGDEGEGIAALDIVGAEIMNATTDVGSITKNGVALSTAVKQIKIDAKAQPGILISINGIAAGLRNTG